jgi:hypothetical protein
MHLPNETTSQKADGEFGLPEQTGAENRRLTSASDNEPGRKSKRERSITQHEEDQAGRGGAKKTKQRGEERPRVHLDQSPHPASKDAGQGAAWWRSSPAIALHTLAASLGSRGRFVPTWITVQESSAQINAIRT